MKKKDVVKIFTVTKNETDLIDDFVTYHGSIFGYSNVVLIDNDSDCKVVLGLYQKFRRLGVNVEHHSSYRGTSQGEAFTKYMLKYSSQCKFMIGLDTDEFIQFPDFLGLDPERTTVSYLRDRFRAYFAGLRRESSKFHVVTYFNSVPDPSSVKYCDQKVDRPATDIVHFQKSPARPKKCFFRSDAFVSTVNGCHNGRVSRGATQLSNLCYVHFHSTGARRSVERARSIIRGYGYADVDSPLAAQLKQLSQVTSPIGSHRVLEYALFLSKTLTLEHLVRRGLWPRSPTQLRRMSLDFPPLFGFPSNPPDLVELPPDWVDLFDDTVLHDAALTEVQQISRSRLFGSLLKNDAAKNYGQPKVALMLSGHLRNFTKREGFWNTFKKEFPDVDIFVHTWTDGGQRGKLEWIDVGKNPQPKNHAVAESVLKPVRMVVENHAQLFDTFSFRQPGVDLYYTNFAQVQTTKDFTKCIGSQLYSIKKCFELTQSTSKTYDVYVRLRADAVVDNFGSLMRNSLEHISDDTIVINGSAHHVHPGGGRGCLRCDEEFGSGKKKHKSHTNDVCDIFYFGRLPAMSKLCHMYDHVKSIVKEFQKENKSLAQRPAVKKYLRKFSNVTTVSSSYVYENVIKCFYPERLIREYMRDFWLVSDTLGLTPRVLY